MKDISEHLMHISAAIKHVYENVNEKRYEQASFFIEDALFHTRCAMLWLKERTDDPTAPDR
jgi:uncharacterized protein (UPF0332 family)